MQLVGLGLTGHSGTIVKRGLLGYRIKFDPGQVKGGNTMFTVRRANLRKG